jgi:hypothetical protein
LTFLKSNGINAKKVKRKPDEKTPDYEWSDIGIEVTAVHDFDPPKQDSLKQFLASNPGNYYLISCFSENQSVEPKHEVILRKNFDWNYSVLHSMQHISYYRKKISDEISKKYQQTEHYEKAIVILDLRTAPFSSITLFKEVQKIINLTKEQYLSLIGIVVATRKGNLSAIDDIEYHYIKNIYSKHSLNELTETIYSTKSSDFDLIERADKITLRESSPVEISVYLLLESAREAEEEIKKRGLPR